MGDTGFNGSADDVTMSSTTTVTVHINPSQGPECKLVRSACIFLYLLSINLHPSAWTFKLLGIRGCGLTRSVKCVKPEPMPCVVYSVSSRAASGSASSISDLPSMQRGGRRGRKKKVITAVSDNVVISTKNVYACRPVVLAAITCCVIACY